MNQTEHMVAISVLSKARLVEYMAEELVKVAWRDILHQSLSRITMNKQKMPVSISDKYRFLSKIDDPM